MNPPTLSPEHVTAARIEALSHATAVLLASRLSELGPHDAARACELFATPLAAMPTDVPTEENAVRRQHREIMLDTLESIADRALQLHQPAV